MARPARLAPDKVAWWAVDVATRCALPLALITAAVRGVVPNQFHPGSYVPVKPRQRALYRRAAGVLRSIGPLSSPPAAASALSTVLTPTLGHLRGGWFVASESFYPVHSVVDGVGNALVYVQQPQRVKGPSLRDLVLEQAHAAAFHTLWAFAPDRVLRPISPAPLPLSREARAYYQAMLAATSIVCDEVDVEPRLLTAAGAPLLDEVVSQALQRAMAAAESWLR